jgi:hypothetical protein
MRFCSDAGERDELLRRFASLEIRDGDAASTPPTSSSRSSFSTPGASTLSLTSTGFPGRTNSISGSRPTTPATAPADTRHLSSIMMALRKLREGIVASKRIDDFAIQVYLFCIRLSVLVKHPESYHPAILHVLRRIHPFQSLTSVELHEVLSYLVLDAACRRGDLAEAYSLRREHGLKDAKVDAVLKALAHDDWVAFGRVKGRVDGHQVKLLEFAEADLRRHTLKCFGRSYLAVDREFLERCAGMEFEGLRREEGVGWLLEGGGKTVVIRKMKAK